MPGSKGRVCLGRDLVRWAGPGPVGSAWPEDFGCPKVPRLPLQGAPAAFPRRPACLLRVLPSEGLCPRPRGPPAPRGPALPREVRPWPERSGRPALPEGAPDLWVRPTGGWPWRAPPSPEGRTLPGGSRPTRSPARLGVTPEPDRRARPHPTSPPRPTGPPRPTRSLRPDDRIAVRAGMLLGWVHGGDLQVDGGAAVPGVRRAGESEQHSGALGPDGNRTATNHATHLPVRFLTRDFTSEPCHARGRG